MPHAHRATLNSSTIIATAMAMADEEGLARLTMRRLGERLGVEAMSLYHHVPNKSALLDAMVDAIFEEIEVPSDPDWRTGLRQRAVSQRRVLHTHRWALSVLESRTSPGLATLRHHDAVLGYLHATGFTMRAAGHAYALLDAFVFGFVLQEQELPFDADSAPDVAGSILALHPEVELPHLAEYAREVVMAGGYDFADEFDVGLGLLLDAVTKLRNRARPAAP